jgi:hypothetical protein
VSVVGEISKMYIIKSIMTLGGKPLLKQMRVPIHIADTVCAIHKAATENGIPKRQIIANGYFSNDDGKTIAVAKTLAV